MGLEWIINFKLDQMEFFYIVLKVMLEIQTFFIKKFINCWCDDYGVIIGNERVMLMMDVDEN